MIRMSTVLALLLSVVIGPAWADEPRITFPADYLQFDNYLSLDRVQNDDQIIRLYANDIARKAARERRELPSGSVIVGEIYKAKKDKNGNVIESGLGRRIRGKLAAVAVMEKGDGWGKRLPTDLRNGDWDFAIFTPDGAHLGKDLNACRSCHAPLADTQHLFSLEHLAN
jgi:Cytochrome P460